MFEFFDNLERQADNKRVTREDAPAQWELLKDQMSQLPAKRFDGQPFCWMDETDAILQLGEVAAQFIDESREDAAKKGLYRIRFGQRPPGPHQPSSGELVHPEDWELRPDSMDGEFIWLMDEKRFLSDDLAEEIATKLTQVYREFKEAARL